MEVFTISGASVEALGASVSPTWLLQNALKALGDAHAGDSALSSVSVDGKLGAKTVAALNYALKTYIGAGAVRDFKLGGRFLNATATQADVQLYIGALIPLVTRAVKLGGGSVPPPPSGAARSSSSSRVSAPSSSDQPMVNDSSGTHTNLAWIIGGASIVVLGIGFLAAKRRAATS